MVDWYSTTKVDQLISPFSSGISSAQSAAAAAQTTANTANTKADTATTNISTLQTNLATTNNNVTNIQNSLSNYEPAGLSASTRASLTSASQLKQPALGRLFAGLAARNTTPANILFVGSSTSAGAAATDANHRWVNTFMRRVQSQFPALGEEPATVADVAFAFGTPSTTPGVHGYNGAEGGTTSATYMTDAEAAIGASLNPVAVFHMVGSNDYSTNIPPATYKTNVQGRITKINSLITKPTVHILIQPYQRWDVTGTYSWDQYGAKLKEIADADPTNVVYIDISPYYVEAGIPSSDPYNLMASDHIHQNNDGHALMAWLVARELGIYGTSRIATGKLIIQDSFNRADSATTLGTTDTNQAWTAASGTWGISSSKAYLVAGSGKALIDAGIVEQDLQAQIVWGATSTAGQSIGLICNAVDLNNYMVFYINSQTGIWNIAKVIAGVATTLVTAGTALTVTSGTTYHVRVQSKGNSIIVYLNGNFLTMYRMTTAEAAQFKPATQIGLRQGAPDAAVFIDNLIVMAG